MDPNATLSLIVSLSGTIVLASSEGATMGRMGKAADAIDRTMGGYRSHKVSHERLLTTIDSWERDARRLLDQEDRSEPLAFELAEAIVNLSEWLARGGFEPEPLPRRAKRSA
jgi:hypothetical protein